MTATTLLQTWEEARTRFSGLLPKISEQDLLKRLHPKSNSAGFLIRHIAEVEQLFAKNVFRLPIEVKVLTLGEGKDKGQFIHLEELLSLSEKAATDLRNAIQNNSDEEWSQSITTKEFGTKLKGEALGRIISHTAYHGGQLALIIKYGQVF